MMPLIVSDPALYDPYRPADCSSPGFRVPALEMLRHRLGICLLDSSHRYVDATATVWWPGRADSSSAVLQAESDTPKEQTPSSMSSADQMNLIVHTLGFNKRQLAELFGVSRQTIYDWLNGSNVSDENASRISVLAHLLMEITANTRRPLYHRFTTQPLVEGEPSILDLLRAEPWDTAHILAQLHRARNLTTERQTRHGTRRNPNSQIQGDENLMDNLLSLGEG